MGLVRDAQDGAAETVSQPSQAAPAPHRKHMVFYYSALNVAACLAVVFLHVNGCFWEGPAGVSWVSSNVIETLFYWAVPIFYMLTGATLMDYRERMSTREYFARRAKRTLVPYVFWSLVGTVWFAYAVAVPQPLEVVSNLLSPTFQHVYWFFIPLFGIYLTIPVFSTVRPRKTLFTYLIVASLVLQSTVPLICSLVGLRYDASIVPAGAAGYFAYALMGYQLSHTKLSKRCRLLVYAAGIVGWLAQLFGTFALSNPVDGVSEVWKGYTNLPAVAQSVAVFVFFKSWDEHHQAHPNQRLRKIVFSAAKYTFGIYLIHMYLVTWIPQWLGFDIHRMAWRLGGPFVVFALAAAVIAALRRIPGVKHLVG